MTAIDTFNPAPVAGTVQFLGRERAYWRLRIKGAALVMVTLGIYRFWLATDVRRFLWSNTEIAGDTLEYNGLATELLVGFLFAIAILVPLYTAIAIAAIELGAPGQISAVLGFAVLALLGEYALYRARRYRLTRTVFRGVRFDQHGSAWLFALFALVWWCAVIVTFGLAFPWKEASLERFKLRRTSYGDLPGRFAGAGWSLFLRGLPMWRLVAAPLVIATFVLGGMIDWDALNNALASGDDEAMEQLIRSSPQLGLAIGVAVTGFGSSIIFAALLYPIFQAVMLRWWLSGLRFGDVVVTSDLRTGQVYRVYLRFIRYVFLFALLALIVVVVGLSVAVPLFGPNRDSSAAELAGSVLMIGFYVVFALGLSIMHQVVVTFSLWRLGVQSAALSGAQALDTVRATGTPSSALGEGLVDALGVGSI
jgi:uncharacterized membrane protein YjgN (DUF898 family)